LPELYLRGEEEYHVLEFSSVQPGVLIPALRRNPLPIFRKTEDDEGEVVFEPAYQVKLPSDAGGILLLGWTSDDEFRHVAIEDNFRAARFNDWLLINTSGKPVAFQVGEDAKPAVMAPATSITHRVKAQKDQGVAVTAQAPFRGEPRTFFSTFWPVPDGKRTVVLFFDDGEKVRIKRISDRLEPAAEEP
jgi:hypothetical protein